jgi:hypothetical protein
VSVEDDKRSVWPSNSRTTGIIEKFENLSTKNVAAISYGVCQGNLTENMNMCHIAPSSRQRTHSRISDNHRVCD